MRGESKGNWFVVGAYLLVAVANQMLWLTFAPIATDTSHYYDVSVSTVGWLAQVSPLIYILLAIPAGLMLDRWFRPALIAGALFTAIGAATRLVDDTFIWALAGQILIAVGQPFVLNAVAKLSVEYLPKEKRPIGIALGSASIFLGMTLGLILSPTLSANDNIPLLLAVQSIFAAFAVLILVVTVRRSGDESAEALTTVKRDEVRTLWADHTIRRLCAMSFFGFGVFIGLTTWLEALLEPDGVTETEAGALLVGMIIAGVIGSALIPTIVARDRAQGGYLRLTMAITAVGCVALGVESLLGLRAATLVVMGFFLLAALPVILEAVERRAEDASGTAAALVWMAGNVGGLLVAVIVQSLVDHAMIAFAVMAAVMVLALPFTFKISEKTASS